MKKDLSNLLLIYTYNHVKSLDKDQHRNNKAQVIALLQQQNKKSIKSPKSSNVKGPMLL